MTSANHVTVRDVLAIPVLSGADVLGPADELDRLAVDLDLLEPSTALTATLRPGSIVLMPERDPEERWSHLLELLVRRAASARSVAVLVPRPEQELPVSVTRVCERLGVVVVLYPPGQSAVRLAVDVQMLVGAPDVVESARLLELVDDAPTQARPPERIVELLVHVLGGRVSIVSARHRFGDADVAYDDLVQVDDIAWWRLEAQTVVAMRVGALGTDEPTWLVATHVDAGRRWVHLARRAVALVRGDVLTWLTAERLEAESRARTRSLVLNEIIERGSAVSLDVLHEADQLGWRLHGWQTGIHVSVRGDAPLEPWAIDAIVQATSTAQQPIDGVVQRSDGWVMWLSGDAPPSPETMRAIVRGLRRGFAALSRDIANLSVSTGIGSPQRDADGLARTLAEAREAATLAPNDESAISVRAVQDLGASRLLLGWYGSGVFREVSRQILAPLTDAGDEEMLRTLEAYLERACSAAQTARVLGVHRNTVAQRVAKVESLLGASLTHADTRLALQLALRGRHHDSG